MTLSNGNWFRIDNTYVIRCVIANPMRKLVLLCSLVYHTPLIFNIQTISRYIVNRSRNESSRAPFPVPEALCHDTRGWYISFYKYRATCSNPNHIFFWISLSLHPHPHSLQIIAYFCCFNQWDLFS